MRWTKSQYSAWIVAFALLPSLTAAAQAPAQNPPIEPPPVSLPQTSVMPALPARPAAPAQPQFVVVLDAAHGGGNQGARIADRLIEKDVVLDLSIRLRSTLSAHGIQVITTRESDTEIPQQTRAEVANHTQAAACIVIHATTTGSGIHLFTSSLAPAPNTRFLPWQTAQSAYVTQSLKLSSDLNSALAHATIPVTMSRAAVQPMDSLTCPAVAVEVAPLAAGNATRTKALSDPSYQKLIVDALTAALEQWRGDWRQQ